MGQRLVRAKRKIRDTGVPFRVPPEHLLPERLDAVLAVLYLIFNEGYVGTSAGRLVRGDLCEEAIRLSKLLAVLLPDEPEVLGLLGLMLLHDSRRAARIGADGALILLEDQDRSLWNRDRIAEGDRLLSRAAGAGMYRIQAEIASVHAHAAAPDDTNWRRIVELYDQLVALAPSPVVEPARQSHRSRSRLQARPRARDEPGRALVLRTTPSRSRLASEMLRRWRWRPEVERSSLAAASPAATSRAC
jgi:RNA polymerase sigma-70 factor (ECF subfamily)